MGKKWFSGLVAVQLVALLLVALLFVVGCFPAEGEEEVGMEQNIMMIVFLVLLVAVFYFLMIRPQRKRQKEQAQLMESLKKGDKVITAGGIYGQIESVSDESIVLKVESGATIRVSRSSVVNKREK